MNILFPFSLRIRAMLIMGLVVFVFMAAFLSQQISIHNLEQSKQLKLKAEFEGKSLASAIAQAMNESDSAFISQEIQRLKNEPHVENAIIYNNSGTLIVSLREASPSSQKEAQDTEDNAQFLVISDVKRDAGDHSEVLGTVTLIISSAYLLAQERQYELSIITLGAIAYVIFMVLYYTIIVYLLYPIRQITKSMLELAGGNVSATIPFQQHTDEVGRMAAAIQTFRDTAVLAEELKREIEHRQVIQVQLEKAKEQADTANVSKSQFLANMSHEIRTPLNGVLGNVQLLEDTVLDDYQRKYLTTIQSSGELLLNLLNDILDLSKIEEHKFKLFEVPFNLLQNIQSILSLFEPLAHAKKLHLHLKIAPNVPEWILADPNRLQQVIYNLLGNAIKYTEQGSIELNLITTGSGEGSSLKFSVKDSGRGIDKSSQHLVFSKFEQFHNSSAITGTGLGLAICKAVVELMKGTIGFESTPGLGSTFWFEVPLVQAAPQSDLTHNYDEVIQNCHVLLAEDVEVNQVVIREFLEKAGCTVDIVANGQDAVKKSRNVKYAMIFMDCNMPIMDGFEATRLIRERGDNETPIIAVSAHAFLEDFQKASQVGMNDYITKPVKKIDIIKTLHKWRLKQREEQHIKELNSDGQEFFADIDPAALDQWYSEFPDKADVFIELTLKDAASLHLALQTALSEKNRQNVQTTAHALKSIVAQIGGTRLAGTCKILEQGSRDQSWDTLGHIIERLASEYKDLCHYIKEAQLKHKKSHLQ